MATNYTQAVVRLRNENETLRKAIEEQERTILDQRSQLSQARAELAALRRKSSKEEAP